jgi:hypothetical protein
MPVILIPSSGPDCWKQFLAKPDQHWVTGYSARTLAYAWETANGFPSDIAAVLARAFGPVEALLAIPEHKTALPGGSRDSQSDVFLLARHAEGVIACTIEGKVDEPFGPLVSEWFADPSAGKIERMAHVCSLLGLREAPADVHYQLLHRTASALIEAERFGAADAAMIVHSFSPERRWHAAFVRFVEALGAELADDASVITMPSGRRLLLAWVSGDQCFRQM